MRKGVLGSGGLQPGSDEKVGIEGDGYRNREKDRQTESELDTVRRVRPATERRVNL